MRTGRFRLVTRLACLVTDCDTGGLPLKNGGENEGTVLDNLCRHFPVITSLPVELLKLSFGLIKGTGVQAVLFGVLAS